jgi:hypothetical protein
MLAVWPLSGVKRTSAAIVPELQEREKTCLELPMRSAQTVHIRKFFLQKFLDTILAMRGSRKRAYGTPRISGAGG